MKLLLHICCAPCSIYPIQELRNHNYDIMGYYYRNNIHPFTECLKRQETLCDYAAQIDLKLIIPKEYDIESFLQGIAYRESNRCQFCYHERLQATARLAKRSNFDAFSTTLLYSKFQNHDSIRIIGESISQEVDIPFIYHDFRIGWSQGVKASKQMGMYRQQYCGCIYSEKERFFRKPSPNNP